MGHVHATQGGLANIAKPPLKDKTQKNPPYKQTADTAKKEKQAALPQ